MVISDFLKEATAKYPDRIAFIYGEDRFTFQEAHQRSNQLAHALLEAGVHPGDRVVIFNTESHRSLEIIFGSAKIGAAFVPLNYRMEQRELNSIFKNCEPRAVFYGRQYEEIVQKGSRGVSSIKTMIPMEGQGGYEAFIEGKRRPGKVMFPDTTPAMIIYTSGTTGPPKGVMFTHKKLVYREIHGRKIPGEGQGLTMNVLLAVPLFHISGIQTCLKGVHSGATLIIMPQFETKAFFQIVERQKVGMAILVPTMIKMLTVHPDFLKFDLSSLFLIIYGGAPMPLTTIVPAMEKMPHCMFIGTYGLTEASGTSLPHQDYLPKEGLEKGEIPPRLVSVGKVVPDMELKIVDEKGLELPCGQVGEILLKGEGIFDGYWGMPEETARLIKDGWFNTGDAGYLDEEGYLFISGRIKELIIRGGENISPLEVETVLNAHPNVAISAVIGIPDEIWGEKVGAVVQLKKGKSLKKKELIEFCRDRLASFKKPEEIYFSDSLPLGPTGKVLKKVLIERLGIS